MSLAYVIQQKVKKGLKEKVGDNKIMGGPRRSVSFGDVSERLFSREQDNGLLRETISEQAITSVHNGAFSRVLSYDTNNFRTENCLKILQKSR